MRSVQSTLFALLVASGAAFADTSLNLTAGVSPLSHDVYELHMTVFWICVAIGIVVFGAMFYAIIFHRKSRGAKPAEFHSHLLVEIAWTIVPVIILVLMAIPSTKVLLNMYNFDQEDLTIKITGYQWKWHYEYLEDGLGFFSNLSTPQAQLHNLEPKGEFYLREVDNPIVVPIHKKIRFLITSNDVNHAWWVPELGVKKDAIAGFINEAWTIIDKPGTYRGQCAELCGINHAFMPIVVIATTEQGYKDWVAKQKGQTTSGEAETNRPWTKDELIKHGEQVYNKICAACHQPNGAGLPPTFPALKGGPIPTGPIAKHLETVMDGIPGSAMQAFKLQLSDVELASVITYERNAWGNNKGDLVQPIQVKAYRDGKSLTDALAVQPNPATGGSSAAPGAPLPAAAAKQPGPETQTQAPAVSTATTAISPTPTTAPAAPVGPARETAHPSTAPATQAHTVSAGPQDLKATMAQGEKIYLSMCAVCHQPSGTGMPPVFPALKGSKVATGPVAEHLNIVLHGKPGTAMQAFKDQLKDPDIAAVITYERNAWENNTGNLVTADDVKAARQTEPKQE